MLNYNRALDIALDTKEPEISSGNLTVVPLISTESLVASRGLSVHIEKLYDAVFKNSDQDKALEKIFNFLSDDAEKFMQRARNLQRALDPERLSTISHAYPSAGIAYLLRGQRSHKTGVWLKGNAAEKQVIDVFRGLNKADDLTFHEFAEWGYKQSVRNEVYWKRQLEGLRGTYHIGLLRDAIDESDHSLVEV